MIISDTTPRASGFRMPAEWESHEACWMWWPWARQVWDPGLRGPDGLSAARDAYAAVARAIARFEPVRMVTRAEDAADARDRCGDAVQILEFPVDDAWARDTGPSFLIGPAGELAGVDWQFNNYGNEAWAGKAALPEAGFANDRRIASRVL